MEILFAWKFLHKYIKINKSNGDTTLNVLGIC